ncbi:sigma-54-dependent transcriptional regulator [Stakelama pacifica]|uniref:DNA-binding NtrC family response regulator n=1 Tax=Stakelama pacifica TaxID=517720 RepID=A0A4R6FIB9_9SPHN|nr:sigma-54 dependent transcriptional regulator [Stakelama pacifica]MAW98533.1 sigma-54-dependent Fis family transcriptional regulator [Sphingomonas sp.]TDN81179.1 DNA-binding NtrC family response regulator [Stakelama pacifica]GGO96984.1 transcriptional regulatory protein FlbD [Stakelama pacifica]
MNGTIVRMLLVGPKGGPFREAAEMARGAGAEVRLADTPADALCALRDSGAGMVMIDVETDVPGFLADLTQERFGVPVLACGIDASAERAVAAIRAGAVDYVPLPPDRELIAAAIRQIAVLPEVTLIGEAQNFTRALSFARAMGPAHAPILISGERGTGKQSVAHMVHAASNGGCFHSVECGGVAPDILASELFGHEAGDFPGARADRRGAFTTARGGTLFLRDIDQLPPLLQHRVLSAIDEPGAPRLIASNSRDLGALVEAGRFRADLLARFALASITIPPLRDRGNDIALLAETFVARFAAMESRAVPAIAPEALRLIQGYEWPGNVAELQEAMHRAVLLAHNGGIDAESIVLADGSRIRSVEGNSEATVEALVGRTVEEVERALILQTLERCNGNRTSASQILGISVRTMRNKLKAFVEAGISTIPAA